MDGCLIARVEHEGPKQIDVSTRREIDDPGRAPSPSPDAISSLKAPAPVTVERCHPFLHDGPPPLRQSGLCFHVALNPRFHSRACAAHCVDGGARAVTPLDHRPALRSSNSSIQSASGSPLRAHRASISQVPFVASPQSQRKCHTSPPSQADARKTRERGSVQPVQCGRLPLAGCQRPDDTASS